MVINQANNLSKIEQDKKPIILIESGQHSGSDTTNLALILIQQLVACEEYADMSIKAKWVILPSVNPDGMEHSIYVSTAYSEKLVF